MDYKLYQEQDHQAIELGPNTSQSPKPERNSNNNNYNSNRTMSQAPNKSNGRGSASVYIGDGNYGQTDHGCFPFEILLTIGSIIIIIVTLPFSIWRCLKLVKAYERIVIFRTGRLKNGAQGPGMFFIIPCVDEYRIVDLRTVSFDVPPQEILSKDSVTVHVDAVVYYRVSNPTIAVVNVQDYDKSTQLLAATTLRNVLGTKNLTEILSERQLISHTMQSSLDEATEPWGVKVERVEIKDARLPADMQRAMATEAEATREAKAKVIAAEGEQQASQALCQAANVIAQSPQALQLRYLQTLTTIAAERNSTIIFPLPLEIFSGFLNRELVSSTSVQT